MDQYSCIGTGERVEFSSVVARAPYEQHMGESLMAVSQKNFTNSGRTTMIQKKSYVYTDVQ